MQSCSPYSGDVWRFIAGAACCVVFACGSVDSGRPASSPTVTIPPDAAPLVQQAQADAATRTVTAANAWAVAELQPAEWPDSSLGCPKPGTFYAQVLTPGYKIKLRAGDRVLEYHAGGGRVVYCSG
jgi:hypothetical protein